MDEKHRLERAALDYFIPQYNRLTRTTLQFQKHQDKPDFIVRDLKSGRQIGIEVKHLFYKCKNSDNDEVKILLGRSDKHTSNLMKSDILIANLNELLKDAVGKAQNYQFNNEMFLIVRVASPVFDKSTFDLHENDIIIPSNVFSEIWLVLYDDSNHKWGDLKKLR